MLRYAISDRTLFPGHDSAQQAAVIRQATVLAREGVEFFQIREKDLHGPALLALTVAVLDAVQVTGAAMRVILNGPADLAARAGVAWHRSATSVDDAACLSASVHSLEEVERQRASASLLLFAPVFGKTGGGQPVQAGVGVARLREAVQQAQGTPVIALGGVTLDNASLCVEAGAAGIAGIRPFLR